MSTNSSSEDDLSRPNPILFEREHFSRVASQTVESHGL
jgi:hypothetical protein